MSGHRPDASNYALALIGGGGEDNEFFNSCVHLRLSEPAVGPGRTATQAQWKMTENPHGATGEREKGHDGD